MESDKPPPPASSGSPNVDFGQILGSLVTFRSAFLNQHGDAIRGLHQWMREVNQHVAKWMDQNSPTLRQFTERLVTILEKLPEWHENLQANMLLLEQGLEVLRSEGFTSTNFIFSARDVLEFGTASPEEANRRLYELTATESFFEDFLKLYESSGLRPERSSLFKEALALHRDGSFGGSTVLMYSQLEGVVADALVAIGGAEHQGPYEIVANGKRLNGLHPKLTTIESKAQASRVFSELLQGVLSSSDSESTVSKTRNYVLHGSDVSFATSKRSTQIILWAFAVLIELRTVLPVQRAL